MKRTMRSAAVVLLVGMILAVPAVAEEKIAVVNVARVVGEYDAAQAAEARLEERAQEYSVEGEALMDRHAGMKREFEKLRDESLDAALNDEARGARRRAAEDKLQEIAALEAEIRETSTRRRRQLEEQRQRVFRSLLDAIRSAIARQAEQDGYRLVLDSSAMPGSVGAVLYHQAGHDLTDAIIARLNAVSTQKSAEPEPEDAP